MLSNKHAEKLKQQHHDSVWAEQLKVCFSCIIVSCNLITSSLIYAMQCLLVIVFVVCLQQSPSVWWSAAGVVPPSTRFLSGPSKSSSSSTHPTAPSKSCKWKIMAAINLKKCVFWRDYYLNDDSLMWCFEVHYFRFRCTWYM